MELGGEDQDADAGEHRVDDGRSDRAEPLPEAELAGDHLDEARDHQDRTEGREAMALHDFEDDHREAGCGAAHLER